MVRLWPLDFERVLMEAEHEAPVDVVRFAAAAATTSTTAVDENNDANGVAATQRNELIATSTSSGHLGVLDVEKRAFTSLARTHTHTIVDIAVDATRSYLASASSDGSLRVWRYSSTRNGDGHPDDDDKLLCEFVREGERPTSVCFRGRLASAESQVTLACGFSSSRIRIFELTTTAKSSARASLVTEIDAPSSPTTASSSRAITSLMFAASGRRLVCADAGKCVRLYDAECGAYALLRLLHSSATGTSGALALSWDQKYLAVIDAHEQRTLTIYETLALNEVFRIGVAGELDADADERLTRCVYAPAATAHLNQLVCATSACRLLKLDATSGRLVAPIVPNAHRASVDCMCVSRDGRFLLTSGDGIIKIWDYEMRLDKNFQVFFITAR